MVNCSPRRGVAKREISSASCRRALILNRKLYIEKSRRPYKFALSRRCGEQSKQNGVMQRRECDRRWRTDAVQINPDDPFVTFLVKMVPVARVTEHHVHRHDRDSSGHSLRKSCRPMSTARAAHDTNRGTRQCFGPFTLARLRTHTRNAV